MAGHGEVVPSVGVDLGDGLEQAEDPTRPLLVARVYISENIPPLGVGEEGEGL